MRMPTYAAPAPDPTRRAMTSPTLQGLEPGVQRLRMDRVRSGHRRMRGPQRPCARRLRGRRRTRLHQVRDLEANTESLQRIQ